MKTEFEINLNDDNVDELYLKKLNFVLEMYFKQRTQVHYDPIKINTYLTQCYILDHQVESIEFEDNICKLCFYPGISQKVS